MSVKMADFKQALDWMRKGKSVVYQNGSKDGLRIKYDSISEGFRYLSIHKYSSYWKRIQLGLHHFDSISWELYEGHDDEWNAHSQMDTNVDSDTYWLYEVDLIKLKEKIESDLVYLDKKIDVLDEVTYVSLDLVKEIISKRFGIGGSKE